jgi:uncharacterized membrane protein YcaP (DUF421 family)
MSMQAYDQLRHILGLGIEPKDLSFIQIALRGIIVFVVALLIVRVSNRRFLSKMSAFDAILGFILASMLARAVNGSASFFPTLGAGFVLVGLHALFAHLSFWSDGFGNLVKGKAEEIAKDGQLDKKTMTRAGISEKDLLEEARLHGRVSKLEEIHLAVLERSGQVSILPKS